VTDAEQPEDERTPDEAAPEAPAEEQPATEAEQPAPEAEAPAEEQPAEEAPAEQPVAEEPPAEEPVAEEPVAEEPVAEEQPASESAAEEPPAEEPAATEEPAAEEQPAGEAETPDAEQPAAEQAPEAAPAAAGEPEEELIEERPRVKPEIPGADLVPDIVPEGADVFGREEEHATAYSEDGESEEGAIATAGVEDEEPETTPITGAAISLASGARYTATGKRKTAVARVILKPGSGEYKVNGKALEEFFPRPTLQRTIRQPLETVAYEAKMDVVAKLHGGGVSAQAGALRHGIARALLEADPNLRGELKRRGFLTRDARAKERKKAGLKKARKRPQFSKR
jgi:small subunit ribosomal protein S9